MRIRQPSAMRRYWESLSVRAFLVFVIGDASTRRFWKSLPLRAFLVFVAAVFFLFSTVGFINDISLFGQLSSRTLVLNVLVSGLLAVAIMLTATRSLRFLPLALGLLVFSFVGPCPDRPMMVLSDTARLVTADRRMKLDAIGTATGVMLGYGFFLVFIATEGRRYLRIQTEMALAREVHQLLAPPIDRRLERLEFFGASLPSSEVGGDLVDLVTTNGRWLAYVADVSGHGVASGTLMAMFKSAARSRLMFTSDPQALLTDLNQVIFDLKKPNMFITCACLAYLEHDAMAFTLAGHLPILHWRHDAGTVGELSAGQVPIGIIERQNYRTERVHFSPGDLFALVTDGLTEVVDRRDVEFGFERLKKVVATHAGRPLPDLFQAVVADVRRHGPQTDDQSILLVRCL